MHYYQFNIGDYRKDTIHLSRLEHSIYRDLIDWYYLEETPIPKETQVVARRLRLGSELDLNALKNVLSDFFCESEAGFRHGRIDAEIAAYHAQCEKNRANGQKGGRPKAQKTQSVSSGLPVVPQTDATANPNHKPLTTNQVIDMSTAKLPTCPIDKITALYNSILPELPSAKVMNAKRESACRKFWKFVLTSKRSDGTPRASTASEAIAWIEAYFTRTRENDFLMGRTKRSEQHASWRCDFDYLLSDKGISQVIEKTREAA